MRPAANVVKQYIELLVRYSEHRGDPRIPATIRDKLAASIMPARREACELLESVVREGLERREHTFLALPVIVPEVAEDWLAWQLVEMVMGSLAVKWNGELCVCGGPTAELAVYGGCTAVFRTNRRKKRAKWCRLCSHKHAERPLGLGWVGPFYLGEPVPTEHGVSATLRVPRLAGSNGVASWRRRTVGIGTDGIPWFGRSDKQG
jgi:hypothetical protein